MGFHEKWQRWISECLRTASVSVLVNGSPTKEFKMGRGLRQGDPLAPFLFLIVAEGFSQLMKKAVDTGRFFGYKFDGGEKRFFHLQYADDTMIISEKRWSNIRTLKAILLLFETMSGLKVNFQKSSITGINVSQDWIIEAANILHCKVGAVPFTYLGLPIGANPNRKDTWKQVINTVRSRLSRWKNKNLSIGGRVVLLKFVLSAVPVYYLSFFKAPSGMWKLLCNWIGVVSNFQNAGWQHLEQFEGLLGSQRNLTMKMRVIWAAGVWCIWRGRNNKVFRGEEIQMQKLVEEAKIWRWLKLKSNSIADDIVAWCNNPKACIGILDG
ncbi:uncharacterized protein LOC131598440 [Vicia villosa]|uniref:uncharacterized protein LOC131598440 n=1 Tax=Vicia villosa TaxID=3911 RepID=UPI00273B8E8C|nr:uncharacterized protein LOC131598440 [Vicia villosa]